MLKALILENFKAFGGRRVIPIRPITLIFGPNSAGKSAILQSLLMLKQTISDPDTGDMPIRLKGSLVDLGSFADLVFQHDTDQLCEVTPVFGLPPAEADSLPELGSICTEVGLSEGVFGQGVRFGQSGTGGIVELAPLPIYLGATSEPALYLSDRESPLEGEEIFDRERNARVSEIRRLLGETDDDGRFPRWWQSQAMREQIELQEESLLVLLREEARKSIDVDSRLNRSQSIFPRPNRSSEIWQALYDRFRTEDVPRFQAMLIDESRSDFLSSDYQIYFLDVDNVDRDLDSQFAYFEVKKLAVVDQLFHSFQLESWASYFPKPLRHFLPTNDLLNQRQHLVHYDSDVRPTWDLATEKWKLLIEFLYADGGNGRFPDLANLTLEMSASLSKFLKNLVYIGPVRERPERHILPSGATPSYVGATGQYAYELLLSDPEAQERVNKTLADFEIGYSLCLEPLKYQDGSASAVYGLRIVDAKSGVTVSVRDVGFGISQVLPVLVQSQFAQDNTVLIEQPELHLHPRLQAELADVFIKSALERSNSFLIETHSEHLVLRLVRRLRDTNRGTLPDGVPPLKPDDVSIIYIHPMEDGSGSVPLVMDLDEDGELLTAWPNGFFEEGFRERFA